MITCVFKSDCQVKIQSANQQQYILIGRFRQYLIFKGFLRVCSAQNQYKFNILIIFLARKMFNKANMQYRRLGNTGLLVSVLSYGNCNSHQVISFEDQVQIVKFCLSHGINYFDTAQKYTSGKDEEDLGKVLKQINEPRQNLVISTKIWTAPNADLNSTSNTNRKHIKESLKGSLKRLQLDYVDIAYAHSYDENTPMEQICRSFHQVIEEGLAFYWGVSNWNADKVFQAFQICNKYNLHRPVTTQSQYNMINRKQVEEQYRTLFQKYRFGLVAFSPLLGGFLTGKYLDQNQKQGRFAVEKTGVATKDDISFCWLTGVDQDKVKKSLSLLKEIAKNELGCDLAALAIAWVLKFQYISSACFGARRISQIEGTLKSLEVVQKLNNEIEGRINKILETNPTARMQWRTFTPAAHFRPLAG